MKVVSTEALTKLIQLIKSSFISVDDTEQTSEIETETPSEVTLATVATTGDYDDLTNKPDLSSKADTNLSNITPTAEAQQNITSWAMPDYDSAIALSVSSYTAPSNGWIYCALDVTDNVVWVYINGHECATGGGNRSNNDKYMVPIKKGQTATIVVYQSTTTNRIETFFPCIGG